MDRLELIKKITALAEIPFSEGEIFLEMFARKVSDELTSGQAVNIPELGSVSFSKEEQGTSSITFGTASGDIHFYLPQDPGIVSYSRYNLSIGKPVLPVSGKSENLNFVFHPHENLHSLESKAEKMFSSAAILSNKLNTPDILAPDEETDTLSQADTLRELTGISPEDEDTSHVFDELVDSTLDEISEVSFDEEENALAAIPDDEDDFFRKLEEIELSPVKDSVPADEISEISLDEISESSFGLDIEDIETVPEESDQVAEKTEPLSVVFDIPEEKLLTAEDLVIPAEDMTLWEEQVKETEETFASFVSDSPETTDRNQHPEDEDTLVTTEETESAEKDSEIFEELIEASEEPLTPEEIFSYDIPEITEEKIITSDVEFIKPESEEFNEGVTETEKVTLSDLLEESDDSAEVKELLSDFQSPGESDEEVIRISSIEEELPSGLEEIPGDSILHEFDKEDISVFTGAEESVELPVKQEDTEESETSFGRLADELISEKKEEQESEEDFKEIAGTEPDVEEKPSESYQRVKSLTREFFSQDLEQQENLLTWEFGDSGLRDNDIKAASKDFEDKTPATGNDGFTFVKSKKSTIEWTPGSLPDMGTVTPVTGDGTTEEIDFSMEDNIFLSGPPVEDEPEPQEKIKEEKSYKSLREAKKEKKRIPPTEEKKEYTREQKKSSVFIIVAGILFIAIIGVLSYYMFMAGDDIQKRTERPVLIDRNDQVPVMLNDKAEQTITATGTETTPSGTESTVTQENSSEITDDLVKIADGIFQKGSAYYVQVSSWQTKSKADREAERYRRSGYKTEIQTSMLRSGLWYRILVGEFSSSEEAENFLVNK